MIEFYKTIDNRITPVDKIGDYTWINMVAPNEKEKQMVIDQIGVEPTFFSSALDEEETSHIDTEDDQTAIIIDIPNRTSDDKGNIVFYTIPLAIIMKGKTMITVCIEDSPIIRDFTNGLVRHVNTQYRTRTIFQIFYRISQTYLTYLKQLDKISGFAEQQLHKSMKNKELFRMMEIEKSLVYFSTSLKANEATLQKIFRGRLLKLYDEDKDLLEDVLIEVKQAIEMCTIYRDILSGTMDAYASIISNNLNIVMKVLTSITILMAIPTMISGFYGMNVEHLPMPVFWFPSAISIGLVILCAIILKKKNML